MASGRFLSTTIADDERLALLSTTAELLYLKTIPHLDRDGMISGKPGFLWGKVCPLREELIGEMQTVIDEWVGVGLVIRMATDAGPALFFPGFLKNNNLPHYKRERPSRFPAPPGYTRTDKGLVALESVVDELQELVQDLIQEQLQESVKEEVQDLSLQDQEEDQDQEQQGDDDDARAREAVDQAWADHYSDPMPEKIRGPLKALIAECGVAAVIHGIKASPNSDSRSFKYIAKCARNYIPPAPQANGVGKSYSVDLPGVYRFEPQVPLAPQPKAAAAALPTSDPWVIYLAEFRRTLPGGYASFLDGSRMELDQTQTPPRCRIVLARADAPLDILTVQLGPAIRRKLLLSRDAVIEIVACPAPMAGTAAEPEPVAEMEPTL